MTVKISKWKIGLHYLLLALLVCIAISLRIFLASNSWPYFNSDEATMGLMARHILSKGEHPLLFYGQDYMGVLEAYLGAAFFSFLDSSVVALRLGMVVLYTLFLLCIYMGSRQLYSKNFALFITALFCFGSTAILSRQLAAIGGYLEAEFFAAMTFALALNLALTPAEGNTKHLICRHSYFFLWSAATALGVWSHSAYLPWIVCTGLLLLFCWRELLFKGAIFSLLAGLLIGGLPLIIYNIEAKPGQDTITVLLSFMGKVPHTLPILIHQIKNTFSVSLPIITGMPTCHKAEFPVTQFWGFEQGWSNHCTILGSIWSGCFLVLAVISAGIGLFLLWKSLLYWKQKRQLPFEQRQHLIRACAHLLLLFGVTIIIIAYLHSGQVLNAPGINSRYLLGIWTGLPAVVRPLWLGATSTNIYTSRIRKTLELGRSAFFISGLALLLSIMIYGSSLAIVQVPLAQATSNTEMSDIQTLLDHGVTHVYANYWFSYRTMFYSNERIICASNVFNYKNNRILIPMANRYMPYYDEVTHDRYAAYVVPKSDGAQAVYVAKLLTKQHLKYREFQINEYEVYQPIKPSI